MRHFKIFSLFVFVLIEYGCSKNTYPCPDIQGGTEVVKSGNTEGLKKNEPEMNSKGRLTKKPYSHSGMKKKKQ